MKRKRNRSESNNRRVKINSQYKLLEKKINWNYTFLLEIERKKITEMYSYFKRYTRSDKMPFVARDLDICINLLNIVLERDNLQIKFTKMKIKRRNNGIQEIIRYPCITDYRKLYINIRNASRFYQLKFQNNGSDIKIIQQEELRKCKAQYLYNKFRYNKIYSWWD